MEITIAALMTAALSARAAHIEKSTPGYNALPTNFLEVAARYRTERVEPQALASDAQLIPVIAAIALSCQNRHKTEEDLAIVARALRAAQMLVTQRRTIGINEETAIDVGEMLCQSTEITNAPNRSALYFAMGALALYLLFWSAQELEGEALRSHIETIGGDPYHHAQGIRVARTLLRTSALNST